MPDPLNSPPPSGEPPPGTPAPAPALHVYQPPAPRRRPAKVKDATVSLYLRVPQSVARNLKFAAVAEDSTMSEIVAKLLEQHLGNWVAPHRRTAPAISDAA